MARRICRIYLETEANIYRRSLVLDTKTRFLHWKLSHFRQGGSKTYSLRYGSLVLCLLATHMRFCVLRLTDLCRR